MSEQVVLRERRDQALLITLNRPAARNAVNASMATQLAAALDELDADPELGVGVITGAPPGFCAGMDLKAFAAGEHPFIDGRGFAGIAERSSRKPLIAAVEGFAVAGGLEIALACDLIVAARDARLAIPEVKRGLIAAGGALLRLPHRIAHNVAVEMALTGDPVAAARLYELGLINRLTDPGGAVPAAFELATAINQNSPLAVRTSK
ncbi:MAG TPA: crotonase/enoyl-CoA hydratase family protein, partial [Solirubrobacteraceae bacterium]|nr:crotonase/enoyl-CoA hydratase family protein [Solirubrobacteraceae bacterium]